MRSVKWTTLTTVGNVLLQLGQMIVLAHLLSPEEFGLMAMVLVVIRILTPLMQAGFSQAIIQDQTVDQDQLSTLYWLNLLLGLGTFGLLALLAPKIGLFFQEEGLTSLLRWSGVAFLILPLGLQYQALFAKKLQFDRLATIQLSGHLAEFALSVVAALKGAGVYALIIGFLGRVTINSILSIGLGYRLHRPGWVLQIGRVRSLVRFGAFEAANQMANLVSAQVDKLIIGRLLGAELLGLYSIAWELIILPIARINPVITRVAFPVYARLQNDPVTLNRYYTQSVSVLMLFNIPVLLGIGLVAEEFLYLFYGPQWVAAGTTLSILAVTGIAKAMGNPGGGILLARGRSDLGFYWNVVWTLALSGLLWAFLSFWPTIEAAAMAQLTGAYTIAWIWHYLVQTVGKLDYGALLRKTGKWLVLSLPMVVGVWLVGKGVEGVAWRFALKVCTGILLYAGSLWLFGRQEVTHLWQMIKQTK